MQIVMSRGAFGIQFTQKETRLWKPGDFRNSGTQNAFPMEKEEGQNDFDHPGTDFSQHTGKCLHFPDHYKTLVVFPSSLKEVPR